MVYVEYQLNSVKQASLCVQVLLGWQCIVCGLLSENKRWLPLKAIKFHPSGKSKFSRFFSKGGQTHVSYVFTPSLKELDKFDMHNDQCHINFMVQYTTA